MTTTQDWTGRVGDVWAREWRRTDRSFADLSTRLDAAILVAAPRTGRAIDLGCGGGTTSLTLATARPDLTVRGVDVSAELVAVATARAEQAGLANLSFSVADLAGAAGAAGAAAAIAGHADLLLSRHGVMFFPDPSAVFAALRQAVRPGAPLVFSCFRAPTLNPWASELVATIGGAVAARVDGYVPSPFAFADRDMVAQLLADAGWRDASAEPVDFRYVAGAGTDPVADAVSFFRLIGPVAAALNEAPAAAHAGMLDKLRATLQDYREGDEVALPAAGWIWTARA